MPNLHSYNLTENAVNELQYLSIFDHILEHRNSSLVPWSPGEFIVVSLARTRQAEDNGGFCRQDLSWQLRAIKRQHGTSCPRPHRWLLSQHLVWAERAIDRGQLPPGRIPWIEETRMMK